MKRWDMSANEHVERPEIDAFLEEVLSVCRKHGLSIAHEDDQGAFVVKPLAEDNLAWLAGAQVEGVEPRKLREVK